MDDTGPYPDYSNDTQVVYPTSDVVVTDSPTFDVVFESTCAGLFWVLLLVHGAVGLSHVVSGRWQTLKRWPLYLLLLAYVLLSCLSETIGLAYTVQARNGVSSTSTYLAYIFFWHASSASFLGTLLALSSGFCITRGDLRGQEPKVIGIPSILFVAGLAADFTFVYVVTTQKLSAAADRYDLIEMTGFESAVWVIGSLANIMCFILAWVVIFDSTQLEIRALDEAQQALLAPEGQNGAHRSDETDSEDGHHPGNGAANQAPAGSHPDGGHHSKRGLNTTSRNMGLLYGMEGSSSNGAVGGYDRQGASSSGAAGAGEEEEGRKATFADTMEYTIRKQLLTRFYYGVCGYLIVAIMVILLPAFVNAQVQNTIVVLEFLVKYAFTVMLAYIFRPAKDSPYLQIGLNESDTSADLDTELTVTELQTGREGGAPAGGPGGRQPAGNGGLVVQTSGLGQAPQLPISTPAEATASRKQQVYAALQRGEQAPANGARSKFTLDDEE